MHITKHNIIEAILITVLGLISAYILYSNFIKERTPSACEINPKSENCYYETMNDAYDHDYQPGAYGPE